MAKAHIGTFNEKKFSYELNDLVRHAVVLGTTGSGKTVMGKVIIEEAIAKGLPVIAIDPKGDLGTVGFANKNFDFRPFCGSGKTTAKRIADKYYSTLKAQDKNLELIQKIQKTNTNIYTPKSNTGIQLSLMPDLTAPKGFKKLTQNEPHLIADFVEPIAESVIQLVNVKGQIKDKAQSLISQILIHNWDKGKDLDVVELIKQVKNPPFESLGTLTLEEFMKEKDRDKLAANINLLLSSPSMKALQQGEKLNAEKLMKPNTLSVFDLRFATSQAEKQFVAEQIMQEIYKYLIRKGGSQRLRFVLYIDELAGLLPPPPANPPSKKLLELLIRQARAFGLGIVVATQSPGDIDYKIFGNLGTRFIGKLRTENDIDKVATAMDLKPSKLKSDLSNVKIGEFVYNNSTKNEYKKIKGRWLLTYHGGPLKANEIDMINNPKNIPKFEAIKPEAKTSNKTNAKTTKKKVKTKTVVQRKTRKANKDLQKLLTQVKKYSDKTQLKITLNKAEIYKPHLRIVIEPKNLPGIKFDLQGPYLFDLTTKLIPTHNYLKGIKWSAYIEPEVKIKKPTSVIKKAIDYAAREAKTEIKTRIFKSTVTKYQSTDKEKTRNRNHQYFLSLAEQRIKQLENKLDKKIKAIDDKIKRNNSETRKTNIKIQSIKAKRMIKRTFKNKNLAQRTKELKYLEKKVMQYKRENKKLKEQIKKHEKQHEKQKQKLKDTAFDKSLSCIRSYVYSPTNKDITIHSTILLVPTRNTER